VNVYIRRKSACNSSNGEKRDGDDMDADSIAMGADLNEVISLWCESVFYASLHLSVVY